MRERLMTQTTLDRLKAKKAILQQNIRNTGQESSGHHRASLHDDASAENELNLARGYLGNIGELTEVLIIKPRKEVEDVGLGNKVLLKYGDGEKETVHFLGDDDARFRQDLGVVTSRESPLGRAIFGKKRGETAKVRLNPEESLEVEVLDILPGDFES